MKRKLAYLVFGTLLFAACTTQQDSGEAAAETPEDKATKFGVNTELGVPQGLAAGTRAPGFATRANDGSSFDLYSELQSGPVVVLFYRGKWCPVCNRYMTNFNDSVQYIIDKGARVIAVTPESKASANEFAYETATEFTVISDQSRAIMKAFDVLFYVSDEYATRIESSKGIGIAQNNESKDGESVLPVPATYVIGQDGYIKFAHFDLNYRNRASVKEIVEHL